MYRLVVIVAAALAAGASAYWSQPAERARPARPDPAPIREALRKFEPWIGEWTGTATYEGIGGRQRSEALMVERIQWKLDGSAILVEGVGRAKGANGEEMVVHNALAVVSYDSAAKKYRFHHWREAGEHGESEIRFEEDHMVWESTTPQGQARFTIHLRDGQWHEIGEVSGDGGKTWLKFMEMSLKRKAP